MIGCSDTGREPDQTRRRGRAWRLAALWLVGALAGVSQPAAAQVLCPAGGYSENALSIEGLLAVQARRVGLPVLWAHEGVCGAIELGRHSASLRVSHAFGEASYPLSEDRTLEQSARSLAEYRLFLKPVADSGALRLGGLLHYEHMPLRGFAHRVQWALGPQLALVEDYAWRVHLSAAYFLGVSQSIPAPAAVTPFQRRSGAWLSAVVGWSVQEGVEWSEELIVQLPFEGQGSLGMRAYLQSTLRLMATAHAGLETALLFTWEGQRPPGFPRWDAVLRAGVVLTL